MTSEYPSAQAAQALVFRSRTDIAHELRGLLQSGQKTVSFLDGGEVLFESRLTHVDEGAQYIALASSPSDAANQALLAQARCIFSARLDDWRLEFVASAPRPTADGAVRLDFPEVLTRWRRGHERTPLAPGVPLQCIADSEGIMPFEGLVVDIGPEGLGFLIRSQSITLEPGTVLKSCIIEIPGKPPCRADLEVCYSQPIVLGDGTHSLRSGCRFLDASGSVRDLVRFYLASRVPEGEAGGERNLI
jgi:hypothetical protein